MKVSETVPGQRASNYKRGISTIAAVGSRSDAAENDNDADKTGSNADRDHELRRPVSADLLPQPANQQASCQPADMPLPGDSRDHEGKDGIDREDETQL